MVPTLGMAAVIAGGLLMLATKSSAGSRAAISRKRQTPPTPLERRRALVQPADAKGRKQHPTASRLRHDIDRGRGRDKVDAIDPAAAPLGTDEEAAGTPVPPEAVAMAYAQEIGSSPASKDGGDHAVLIYVSVVGAIAGAVGFSVWLTGPL
jgi:hypothetical protein